MLKTSTLALTALLAGSVSALAMDVTGGSVSLSYEGTDFDGDTLTNLDIGGNIALALTPAISATGFLATGDFYEEGDDAGFGHTDIGFSVDYGVAPNATAGLFYQNRNYSEDGGPGEFDQSMLGIQGSVDVSDTVKVSGYLGQYGGDEDSDISSLGLRGDFALDGGIGLYGFYQVDSGDGFDISETGIGGSYDLAATAGMPLVIFGQYSFMGGDLPDNFTHFEIGVSYVFGGEAPGGMSSGIRGVLPKLF